VAWVCLLYQGAAILLARHDKIKSEAVFMLIQSAIIVMERYRGLVRWLQAVILWLMNFNYCFMKRVWGVFIFVILLMTACSTVQELPSESSAATTNLPTASDAGEAPDSKLEPTDPDVMYHVFAAEVLGDEGDFSAAAAEYLEAALISDDPEIAERAARVAVSAGEWQMVALASDRWAMLDPTNLDAHELAAGSRLREGDYVGAGYQLARILEMTTADQAQGWRIVIALLAPANDQVRANKVLDNLLKDFDAESNVDALFARSQLAARMGDLDKATDLVNKAIVYESERADLYAWSGRLAVNNGNQSLALKRYRQAWQVDSEDQVIAMAYAELLKRNDDIATAQSVLAQLPDKPEMRFARVIFALDAGDRKGAELLYEGFASAPYPDSSETAFHAAQSAELLDHPEQAIAWYKQVTGERSLRAVIRRAFLLADLGKIEEARNILAQLRIQSDNRVLSQSYQAEAQILQDAGQRDEAFHILGGALDALPEDVPLRYARALLAVSLGQLDLAESDFRQIISVQPDNAAAINALGYTLADLTDRYEEAEQLILQAFELQPEDASIIDSMGWVSYRLGRLKMAEKYLREAWKSLRNAEIAAHLGEVLWASGQRDEARSLWKLGTQMEGDNEVLMETMQRFGVQP
jgi:tetratricopeptide (TPR) repeat protein